MRFQQQGFTLIELMIVCAIIAILSGIAYPMYLQQVQKSRRADVIKLGMTLALAQERMRSIATTNATFTTDLSDAGLRLDPHEIISNYYDVAVTAGPDGIATSYLLTLTAKGAQLDDENCRTMTINQLNLKTALAADGSTDTTDICW